MAKPKKEDVCPVRKYISKIPGKLTILKRFDDKGNPVTVTDATGNGKVVAVDEIKWHPVHGQMLPDGKTPDPEGAFCFIIVKKVTEEDNPTQEEQVISDNYDRLVEKFDLECKNPINKVYTEDDYQKQRNVEAFNAKKQTSELTEKLSAKETELAEANKRLAELEARFGVGKDK